MKILKTIKHSDIVLSESDQPSDNFRLREAARAVVFDENDNISLLHVTKLNYHKLPGGGIEEGEDISIALQREALEEIGCNIEVLQELGQVNEYRDDMELFQKSYCYLAKVVGDKGEPSFTDDERDNGFEIVWMKVDDALKTLSEDVTESYEGKFIIARDITFLMSAKDK